MERAEKIFTILAALGLVGVLVSQHGAAWSQATRDIRKIPLDPLTGSKTPDHGERAGPAYLLSNLPAMRRRDDYAQPVSVGVYDYAAE